MKIVVSVNVSPNIFFLLIVSSVFCNFVKTPRRLYRPTGCIGDFGNFSAFSLKAYYCSAHHIEQIVLTEQSWQNEIPFMKSFYSVVNSVICFAKEASTSIVLFIEWV